MTVELLVFKGRYEVIAVKGKGCGEWQRFGVL